MRTVTVAAVIALIAAPAFAQMGTFNPRGGPSGPPQKTDQEKAAERKQQELDDKAYKDSVSRIPERERERKFDPWANVR